MLLTILLLLRWLTVLALLLRWLTILLLLSLLGLAVLAYTYKLLSPIDKQINAPGCC